jgi:hypothetical protein
LVAVSARPGSSAAARSRKRATDATRTTIKSHRRHLPGRSYRVELARPPAARAYAIAVTEHVGASGDGWRVEHGDLLEFEGTLAVGSDGLVTIDVGDGVLRPLGAMVAEYFESWPDAVGHRVVGRVGLRVDLLAAPASPVRSGEPTSADPATALVQRRRDLERRRDQLQAVLARVLDDPWRIGPDGPFWAGCREVGEHADDCAVLRRDELLRGD